MTKRAAAACDVSRIVSGNLPAAGAGGVCGRVGVRCRRAVDGVALSGGFVFVLLGLDSLLL